MFIADQSIRRPVATGMIFLIIVTIGMIGFRFLPVDLLPPIEFPDLTIAIDYPNVGPEEIEQIITERVENAVAGISNLERITSSSSEGQSRVRMRFSQGANMDEAANDVRAALDRIRRNLPAEIDPPRIWKFDPNDFPIINIAAQSDRPLAELTEIMEREISKKFEQVPGVGAIDVWGGVYREVQVDLLRDRLNSANLGANDVVDAIGRENVNLPGGNIRAGIGDLYVRTLGEYTDVGQISDTVIRMVDGNPIRIGDVARVQMGYQDIDRYVVINDRSVVPLDIRKQDGANTVAVAERVHRAVERINASRSDLNLIVVTDQSEFIQNSMDNVRNSAIWGGILAVIVLLAFLRNGSVTLIIAISIPISIIATFGLLYFNGLTLNQMSFGGIALGVGLIVDNAIVVLENIVRQRQGGADLKRSAGEGTRQVTGAIIAATLTTSVIFLPVIFMRTVTGSMFQELALVVVFALFCSLIVALTLVPMLASQFMTIKPTTQAIDGNAAPSPSSEQQSHKEKRDWFEPCEDIYVRILRQAIAHRFSIFAGTAILLTFAIMLFPRIPFELTPETDGGEIQIRMRLEDGTNIAILHHYMRQLDRAVREVIPMDDILYLTEDVRTDRAVIRLTMRPASERSMPSNELADIIRRHVRTEVPGAEIQVAARSGLSVLRRTFGGGGGNDDGDSLELQLRGNDMLLAEELTQEIIERISNLHGITDANSSSRVRRPQQNIRIDRERVARLGIGVQDVAQAMQTNVGGRRAGLYRLGSEEIPITVRLQPDDRRSSEDLDNISIRIAAGSLVPVSTLIQQETGSGPASIARIDGQRVSYINANLERGMAMGNAVQAIQSELSSLVLPEGFSIFYGGEFEEQQRAQKDFTLAIITALALIYMVMAAQFERFIDPLIVMFSVPLIIIGVVPTLLITGTTLNIQSLMGIVMLIGIVVNNAIVLVDYINLLIREQGMAAKQAVLEAGRLRLRPILMTTSTTMLALIPLSIGIGDGGEIQASLARVVIGGLISSTLITLVLIPVVFLSIDSLRTRRQPAMVPVNA